MLEVEGERAKRRQKVAGEQFGRGVPKVTVKSPEAKGEARQVVADKLGSAPQKVTQAAAVVKAIDEMEHAGDKRGNALRAWRSLGASMPL